MKIAPASQLAWVSRTGAQRTFKSVSTRMTPKIGFDLRKGSCAKWKLLQRPLRVRWTRGAVEAQIPASDGRWSRVSNGLQPPDLGTSNGTIRSLLATAGRPAAP
ncbi:hypothetical protein CK231_06980 [Mesorhizobium loti]|uniref:Uncharacterized protein n=1 Tax=Mesorhizobium erdmanii TaxID=1777866 RepID=A0A4Q1V1T7_9HYPH|nr:hypothetical protein CK231_06980 [Mesorhizobium loti]RXT45525.1 hypothetical protein B5V01_16025 [Mesorhizobium erdmanii]PBB50638.1 hypothetical protein CK213_00280 [Mesorhizobium loti]PBB55592.1 hypothetical protein CK223_10655 [Mesorhizobium loti]PBB61346.1 hypothetical protein CK217_12345 [Mesorhizobium loti]